MSRLSDSNDDGDSSDRSTEQTPSFKVFETQYTVKTELGGGGYGKSFLVTNAEEIPHVIKEINPFEHEQDKVKEGVLKELNHPYIADTEDSFKDEAGLYTVTEYCEGGDLHKRMQIQKEKEGFFEEQQILDWLVQICLALQHLHNKNILHRNIKPQNIFLTEDGYINLGDFGCSELLNRAGMNAKNVVLTDDYVSPDVLEQKYDFKCDVWSLGWLLHDLCMLDVWSDIIERRYLHALSMKGTPPQISDRYSEELRELIRQMLSRHCNNRPSADDILEKTFLRDAVKRNKKVPEALEDRFYKASESIEEKYNDLKAFLSEWGETIDFLEETHRNCTIASLSGSVIGAAGGITALVGAVLAPFTFGVSLIVSGVGIGVGVAGGVTSAASNITNTVKQRELHEKMKTIGQKYSEESKQILSSPDILRLLKRIQKFIMFEQHSDERKSETKWRVTSITFILIHATRLSLQLFASLTKTSVLIGAEAGATGAWAGVAGVAGARVGVQVCVRAGAQAARAARAAAEAAVAVAAVSGVLGGLLIIADAAFIVIDSREIHQMNQGKIDDPDKVKSSVLKGIAQMRKMHKEFENVLEGIIEIREAIKNKSKQK